MLNEHNDIVCFKGVKLQEESFAFESTLKKCPDLTKRLSLSSGCYTLKTFWNWLLQ